MFKKRRMIKISLDEYIRMQMDIERLTYQKINACNYIVQNRVLDRKVLGELLRIPKDLITEKKNG